VEEEYGGAGNSGNGGGTGGLAEQVAEVAVGGGTPPECGEPLQPLAGRTNVVDPVARAGCRIMEMEKIILQAQQMI
jgi:hypothetical protein